MSQPVEAARRCGGLELQQHQQVQPPPRRRSNSSLTYSGELVEGREVQLGEPLAGEETAQEVLDHAGEGEEALVVRALHGASVARRRGGPDAPPVPRLVGHPPDVRRGPTTPREAVEHGAGSLVDGPPGEQPRA